MDIFFQKMIVDAEKKGYSMSENIKHLLNSENFTSENATNNCIKGNNNEYLTELLNVFIFANSVSEKEYSICVFDGCTFYNDIHIFEVNFKGKLIFNNCVFNKSVIVEKSSINNEINLHNCLFKDIFEVIESNINKIVATKSVLEKQVCLLNSDFGQVCNFDGSRFLENIIIEYSCFEGPTYFSNCIFSEKDDNLFCEFYDVIFYDVSFNYSVFNGGIDFRNATFNYLAEFINTKFSDTQLSNFEIKEVVGSLCFKSTDSNNKLFCHSVVLGISSQIKGVVEFENVDFNKLPNVDIASIIKLSKLKKVVIGKGCIKYRVQSEIKTINLVGNYQHLVIEIANTFSHFFSTLQNYTLGVEIVEQNFNYIKLFYFSSDDLEQEDFEKRLAYCEELMWQLVQVKGQNIDIALNEDSFPIAILDTMINLSAIILKIGARTHLDEVDENILQELSNSVSFIKNKKQLFSNINIYKAVHIQVHGDNNKIIADNNNSQIKIS